MSRTWRAWSADVSRDRSRSVPNPREDLEKLKDAALDAVQHPRRTAEHLVGKAVGVAKGSVDAGKAAAGLVAARLTGGGDDAEVMPPPSEPPEPDDEADEH